MRGVAMIPLSTPGLLMSTVNAPQGRAYATAVWTGTDMIRLGRRIWTTREHSAQYGGIYHPSNDTWSPTSTVNAPRAYSSHRDLDGSRMNRLGGNTNELLGAIPAAATHPPPIHGLRPGVLGKPSEAVNSAVWTGNDDDHLGRDWGGTSENVSTAARYSPVSDSWTPTTLSGAASARNSHSAVWTGNAMIVWGRVARQHLPGQRSSLQSHSGCVVSHDDAQFTTRQSSGPSSSGPGPR
jgi:hypothetical protein